MTNDFALQLRRNTTDAEALLWRKLRAAQLAQAKFRRQQPIGPYIADFVSFGYRLIVECDGGQHADNPGDMARDAWFADEGFRTLRFWNNDVLGNIDGVLETIMEVIQGTPSPQPSPLVGEGWGEGS